MSEHSLMNTNNLRRGLGPSPTSVVLNQGAGVRSQQNLNDTSVFNRRLGLVDIPIDEEPSQREDSEGGRSGPDQQLNIIDEADLVMYQRFSNKIATWESLNFLLMIFEGSFLAIAVFLIVYLRSRYSSPNDDSSSNIPLFSVFTITSGYPFLKIIWFTVLYMKGKS